MRVHTLDEPRVVVFVPKGHAFVCLQAVLDTDVERTTLLQEEADLLNNTDADVSRLDQIYDRMNDIDAHGAEAKVELRVWFSLGHVRCQRWCC